MDLEEIRQSPRQFVDLKTVEWLSDQLEVTQAQLQSAQDECTQWEVDYNELNIELEEVKALHTGQANCIARLKAELATETDKGFNDGIENVAKFFDEDEHGLTAAKIRTLKREIKEVV